MPGTLRDASTAPAIGQRLRSLNLVVNDDALFAHIIFVAGQIVGGWKRSTEKGNAVVALNLIAPLSAIEQKRIGAAVARVGRFLGDPNVKSLDRNV